MTTIPSNLAGEFIAAGHANHIPPEVLAGVAQVESGMGSNRGPSSAGAVGLMQFMPGTAAGLGINPRDDRSAIWGAAKLLNRYGYQSDPIHALSSYNAGPAAGPTARAQGNAYATLVMRQARALAPALTGRASSSAPAPATAAAAGGGGLGQSILRLALEALLIAAGGVLIFLGGARGLAPGAPA